MEVRRYRKIPLEVDAVQLSYDNRHEVAAWSNAMPEGEYWLRIETLEGIMVAKVTDWVVKGIKGEFYPCKPEIFDKSYELVVDKPLSSREAVGDPNS